MQQVVGSGDELRAQARPRRRPTFDGDDARVLAVAQQRENAVALEARAWQIVRRIRHEQHARARAAHGGPREFGRDQLLGGVTTAEPAVRGRETGL